MENYITNTKILKGNVVAERNKMFCLDIIDKYNLTPHIYILLIGNDPASKYYVDSIKKKSEKYKIKITIDHIYDDEIDESILINKIMDINNDPKIHGIMVQKPLPKHIDAGKIEQLISAEKDIDGLHALNTGLMLSEKECFLPCTAQAIIEILDFYGISTEGKHVVVLGRSNIVGKPIANLLLNKKNNRNATVTICHSKTQDISVHTRQADIIITAIGVANFLKAYMVKENVIIIDAGINEIRNNENEKNYVGDVDYNDCIKISSAITPVPGGVGAVTTSILLKHACISNMQKVTTKILNK